MRSKWRKFPPRRQVHRLPVARQVLFPGVFHFNRVEARLFEETAGLFRGDQMRTGPVIGPGARIMRLPFGSESMFGERKEGAGLENAEGFGKELRAIGHVHGNVLRIAPVEDLIRIRQFVSVSELHVHGIFIPTSALSLFAASTKAGVMSTPLTLQPNRFAM